MRVKEYRRKIIYKTIQDLNKFCSKDMDSKNIHLIPIAFNGIFNDYLLGKEKPTLNLKEFIKNLEENDN
jgi:hypothetical protein